MLTCASAGITLRLEETAKGFTQIIVARGGRPVCTADPSGDVGVRGPGRARTAAAYSSAAPLAGAPGIEARLRNPAAEVTARFTPAPDACGFDVALRLTAVTATRISGLLASYALPPDARPDFAWLPCLKRSPRDVAGDHVFRSPCLIVRWAGAQAALVPRLDAGLGSGPLRATLDYALPRGASTGPRFSIGLRDYRAYGHVYYRPTEKPVALPPGASLDLGYTLLFDEEPGPFSWRPVLRFLWRRYGERSLVGFGDGLDTAALARLWADCTFERHGMWRGFTLDGRECGGIPARIVRHELDDGGDPLPRDTTPGIALNYLLTPVMRPGEKARMFASLLRGVHPHLGNTIFFNNVRSSFGMAWYGRLWNDTALLAKARAIWSLALAAPAPAGIFPSMFCGDGRRPGWVPGTKVWRYTGAFHVPNAAVTGWWMLAIDRHLSTGGLFDEKTRRLGDFLLRARLPSGAVPTWVRARPGGRPRHLPDLRECAGSAAAGMFLAALASATGVAAYREAARGVADFIIDRVVPTQEWHDTEVFFSCSEKPLGWRDRWTGIPAQGTLCLAWTAELLRELYAATAESRYLEHGRACLDLLLLYQQIWNPPFISFDARGGFGVMNTDAEWSDARQADLGILLLAWHELTGEEELLHRGRAALAAGFTLMHQHGPDRGSVPENYGHSGRDRHILGYIMPDWGGGTAVAAAALAAARWPRLGAAGAAKGSGKGART
jgi:hypothetical protein